MGHPIVHFEFAAKDAKKLQAFYGELFQWKIDFDNSMDYWMIDTGEGGFDGGIMQTQGDITPYLTIYVKVENLQAYLDKAERLGGKTIVLPTPIPNIGSFAMFQDPEGNLVGLFKG